MKRIFLFLMMTGCIYHHLFSQDGSGKFVKISLLNDYVEKFNLYDDELFATYIPNSDAAGFLAAQIPRFECPDREIEEIYYFRWWTFRKHIRQTPDGFIITEFLPDVPWAGKYNAISCPGIHQFSEGRWLRNGDYLRDYARYWFRRGGSVRSYSFPVAHALYSHFLVSGDDTIVRELFPDLIANFREWENERYDATRELFWQIDDRDGMEVSVCGSGFRPTINSYMAAEAQAIANIAGRCRSPLESNFSEKSKKIQSVMLQTLWDADAAFFKVLPRTDDAVLCDARELHGYTPWYFNLAGEAEYTRAWKFLMNPSYFYAPYGPTTVERNHSGFVISYSGHECQWNGPSWPFATSVVLTALANLLNTQNQNDITKNDYFDLLKIYTKSHRLTKDDGMTVPWIDENINPFTGDWISRTRLKTWRNGSWAADKGGVERGKDYNHSVYCDLIISGLAGIRANEDDILTVNPLLPDGIWDYFCLEDVVYHGKRVTVAYDKTGSKYNMGKGLMLFVDGELKATAPSLSPLRCQL